MVTVNMVDIPLALVVTSHCYQRQKAHDTIIQYIIRMYTFSTRDISNRAIVSKISV